MHHRLTWKCLLVCSFMPCAFHVAQMMSGIPLCTVHTAWMLFFGLMPFHFVYFMFSIFSKISSQITVCILILFSQMITLQNCRIKLKCSFLMDFLLLGSFTKSNFTLYMFQILDFRHWHCIAFWISSFCLSVNDVAIKCPIWLC